MPDLELFGVWLPFGWGIVAAQGVLSLQYCLPVFFLIFLEFI